jgi:aspartyl-tRNA(Asn)/glutamyl-tRNA(Gln) amidotransferase subunit B
MAELLGLLADRTINVPAAKEVLAEVIATGARPGDVVEQKGLGQISDEGELVALVERLLADNPAQAQQLRDGKDKVVGFFVGQAMKATGGKADPARVGELVRERAAAER